MVESIKQEPMECAIEHPPLKKIKQEVLNILNTAFTHRNTQRDVRLLFIKCL